jgi:hypothetical protein
MTALHTAAGLGVGLALAGCQKAQEAGAPLASAKAPVVVVAPPADDDPLAAAKNPATATPAQTQATQDSQDNARSREVAQELVAHPDWLARQEAICGPGDSTMQARYAARQGPPDAELRDLKVACMAKDIARQAINDALTRKAGVNDTGSL